MKIEGFFDKDKSTFSSLVMDTRTMECAIIDQAHLALPPDTMRYTCQAGNGMRYLKNP